MGEGWGEFIYDQKNGTGLGLAISQKIVEEHGGSIWCESDKERRQDRFIFIIPCSKNPCGKERNFSKSSLEILEDADSEFDKPKSKFYGLQRHKFEKMLSPQYSVRKKTYAITLIEDERVYANLLEEMICLSKVLRDYTRFTWFSDGTQFFESLQNSEISPDLVIGDSYLNDEGMYGFEIKREIRRIGVNCQICLHFHVTSSDTHKHAINSGANFFTM